MTLSLTGFDKTAAEQKPIDTTAVINALRDALTTDSVDELGAPRKDLPEGASESEIQRDLFSRNFAAIATLIKKELGHIENGVYKFPYDLDPTDPYAANQWNPLSVASKANTYVNDRKLVFEDVMPRTVTKSRKVQGLSTQIIICRTFIIKRTDGCQASQLNYTTIRLSHCSWVQQTPCVDKFYLALPTS